jgi:hypothetical protein
MQGSPFNRAPFFISKEPIDMSAAATSAAKLAANRINATLSTGPTDTSRTRFNGLAHGLTSKQTVIRGESQQEYDTFESNLRNQLAPVGETESLLADRIIAAAWRLKRFARIETSFFNNRIDAIQEENSDVDADAALAILFCDPAEMARMRLFLRYQTTVHREYDKARREFESAQAQRAYDEKERAYLEYARNRASVTSSLAPPPGVGFASQTAPQATAASNLQSPVERTQAAARSAASA